MAGGDDRLGSMGGPLLYGIVAAVVGVVAAVVLAISLGGGGTPVAVVSSSSTPAAPTAERTPVDSAAPSVEAPTGSPSESVTPTTAPLATPVTTSAATDTPPAATAPPTRTPRPTPTPTPTPTPSTNPAIVSFSVPATEDCTDATAGTISIAWTLARATGATLSIDGPGIFDSYAGLSQSIDVPFACSHETLSHTYTLTTTGGTGPAATSTKTVTAAAPTITKFRLGAANCPSGDPSVAIALTYEVVAATGVELKRDAELYSTYSGKTSSNGLTVVYDCSKASQTFTLTTTGGFGPESTRQQVVNRSSP